MTASSKFTRKGILRDPIDGNLFYYMQTSCSPYKKKLLTKQEAMLKWERRLTMRKNPKIKGAKMRSKMHEKVTLKSTFQFGSIFFAYQSDSV